MRIRFNAHAGILAFACAMSAHGQVPPHGSSPMPPNAPSGVASAHVTNMMTEQQQKMIALEKRMQLMEQHLVNAHRDAAELSSRLQTLKAKFEKHTHKVPHYTLTWHNEQKDKVNFVPQISGFIANYKDSDPPQ